MEQRQRRRSEVFGAAGNFNGPITIDIFGRSVYDNGTEMNDTSDGPAFVVGIDATAGPTITSR